MSRPGWVLMVGILMLTIGGCGGFFADLKQIKTEELLDFAAEAIEEIQVEVNQSKVSEKDIQNLKKLAPEVEISESDTILTAEQIQSVAKSVTYMSDEAQRLIILHGYLGLVVSIFYGIIGIVFFKWKDPKAIKLVLGILVISLLFVVYQFISLNGAKMSPLFTIGQKFNLGLGAIFDLFLLLVVGISDKSYFESQEIMEDHYDTSYTS